MFDSFKIKRLVSQILSSPGQDVSPYVRSLREYGEDGLNALVETYVARKITDADFERHFTAFYERDQMELFIGLLGHPKEQVRSLTRGILEKKAGAAAVPRLVERLKENNVMLRRGIADLLKKIGSSTALEKLTPYLHEDDKELKGIVIGLIAELGGSQAAGYLMPLMSSPDWWLRKKTVEAICKAKDSASIGPLVDLLKGERDPKIKMTIIQTLGQIGNATAARAILSSIADNDLVVRQMVVEALENIADESLVPDIINSMREADVNVRRAGVEILSKLKSVDSAETLIRCIQDADWWVREIAIDALALVNKSDVGMRVRELFSNADENVRRAAVEYFNRLPDPATFDALAGLLHDPDWWVREKAVSALGKLRDERAIDLVMELRNDYDVRWVVPQALGDIGGARAVEHLCDFMDDPERNVRMEALKSLGKINDKNTLAVIKATVKDSDADIRDMALQIIKSMTGHAVKANQIIAEQTREKWSGGSTIFTSPFLDGARVRVEAILVLDLANSTDIGAKYGDDFALRLTNRLVEETKPISTKHRARFTKSTGDGYLMAFNEISHAVNFAAEMLDILKKSNAAHPPQERIDVRIAINVGETRIDDKGDRLGTAVNMTFRVEGVKPKDLIPDEGSMKPEEMPLLNRILVTEPVKQDVEKNGVAKTRFVGFFELKGIPGRHRIYQVTAS